MTKILAGIGAGVIGLLSFIALSAVLALLAATMWGLLFMFIAWLMPTISGDLAIALNLTKYSAFQLGAAFGIGVILMRSLFGKNA